MRPAQAESRPEDRNGIGQFRQLVKRLFVLDNDDMADAPRKLNEFTGPDALLAKRQYSGRERHDQQPTLVLLGRAQESLETQFGDLCIKANIEHLTEQCPVPLEELAVDIVDTELQTLSCRH